MSSQKSKSNNNSSKKPSIKMADPAMENNPSVAPSEAPELVEIPEPPTQSQLVVKSTGSSSVNAVSGASKLPATRSIKSTMSSAQAEAGSKAGSRASKRAASTSAIGSTKSTRSTNNATNNNALENSRQPSNAGPSTAQKSTVSERRSRTSPSSPKSVSQAASQPPTSASPASAERQQSMSPASAEGGPESVSPASDGGGGGASTQASSPNSTDGGNESSPVAGGSGATNIDDGVKDKDGKKKKTAHFRYHKRVTVRTKGKQDPNKIMAKVNNKDHKNIEDMDPKELMKRAGIKPGTKAHWRVRLRQTERITKNGKTITQTKVSYRDSEGNKRTKSSTTPNCQKCGRKLEECECANEN